MVFQQIIAAVDIILGPITTLPPYLAITLVSIILTSLILTLNKIIFRKNILKELKYKMEEIRENLTKAQQAGNKGEVEKFLNEMMKINTQFMKHSIKTLFVSLIVISLIFPWLHFKYEKIGYVVALPFNLPYIGSSLNWVYWYVFISLAIGWVLNKLLS
ncbi:MAG: EMC3/TMCO1 family protein [Candidatus Aenigmatarchaeota archaeon]